MGFCGIVHTIILSYCNYSQIQIKVSPPPQSYELTTRMDGPNRPIGCLKPWRVPGTQCDSVVIRATCDVWETK